MTVRAVLATLLALSVVPPAMAQDAPGSNPIIRDKFTADPAALVVGDTVYLYAGHDASDREGYDIPEWLLYSSKDMKTWTPHGVILKPTDFSWSTGEAWASQVVEKGGKYYFFTTAQDRGVPGGRRAAKPVVRVFVGERGSREQQRCERRSRDPHRSTSSSIGSGAGMRSAWSAWFSR